MARIQSRKGLCHPQGPPTKSWEDMLDVLQKPFVGFCSSIPTELPPPIIYCKNRENVVFIASCCLYSETLVGQNGDHMAFEWIDTVKDAITEDAHGVKVGTYFSRYHAPKSDQIQISDTTTPGRGPWRELALVPGIS
jgi:hypothetical protein